MRVVLAFRSFFGLDTPCRCTTAMLIWIPYSCFLVFFSFSEFNTNKKKNSREVSPIWTRLKLTNKQ